MSTQPPVGAQRAQRVPLLRTKLYIPPFRSDLVPRPRPVAPLNASLRRKLTLLFATAGFGKTTLLSEWRSTVGAHRPLQDAGDDAPLQAVWLSLDEGDNDPTRCLTYFCCPGDRT
jgi:LuxR family maltose regulon positive regulatory protein